MSKSKGGITPQKQGRKKNEIQRVTQISRQRDPYEVLREAVRNWQRRNRSLPSRTASVTQMDDGWVYVVE